MPVGRRRHRRIDCARVRVQHAGALPLEHARPRGPRGRVHLAQRGRRLPLDGPVVPLLQQPDAHSHWLPRRHQGLLDHWADPGQEPGASERRRAQRLRRLRLRALPLLAHGLLARLLRPRRELRRRGAQRLARARRRAEQWFDRRRWLVALLHHAARGCEREDRDAGGHRAQRRRLCRGGRRECGHLTVLPLPTDAHLDRARRRLVLRVELGHSARPLLPGLRRALSLGSMPLWRSGLDPDGARGQLRHHRVRLAHVRELGIALGGRRPWLRGRELRHRAQYGRPRRQRGGHFSVL